MNRRYRRRIASIVRRDLPDVLVRQPPVIVPQHAQIDDGVRLDAACGIDVRLDVAERERARRREERQSSVQAGIARARDRSPSRWRAIDEDDVIEQVDRLEAQDERRVSMLLHDRRGGECGFETVCRACTDDTTKAPQRLAPGLRVVRQCVQPALDGERRTKPVDDLTLRASQRKRWRIDRVSAWERGPR
jgi:hypothetical protein